MPLSTFPIVKHRDTGKQYRIVIIRKSQRKVKLQELAENSEPTGEPLTISQKAYDSEFLPLTVKLQYSKGASAEEWIMKEWGSYEDSGGDPNHVVALLQQFNGNPLYANEAQLKTIIRSGEYNSTSWQPDEIAGGKRTILNIANITEACKKALKTLQEQA